MDMELLTLCDEVWVFWKATEGMAVEIAPATEQGKTIIFKETEGGSTKDKAAVKYRMRTISLLTSRRK